MLPWWWFMQKIIIIMKCDQKWIVKLHIKHKHHYWFWQSCDFTPNKPQWGCYLLAREWFFSSFSVTPRPPPQSQRAYCQKSSPSGYPRSSSLPKDRSPFCRWQIWPSWLTPRKSPPTAPRSPCQIWTRPWLGPTPVSGPFHPSRRFGSGASGA